jgi:hypothetical protein
MKGIPEIRSIHEMIRLGANANVVGGKLSGLVEHIPFVGGSEFPSVLKMLRKPIIFGFVINPNILVEIRENRMHLLQIKESSDYTDIKVIQEECREVRRLCSVNNWQVIEVSRRSIEETAAIIMKYYYEHKKMPLSKNQWVKEGSGKSPMV